MIHTFRFAAMGSPCEVQVDTRDAALANRLSAIARDEAMRIEVKFSRYRPDSVVGRINQGAGTPFQPDGETAMLLDYAAQCHGLSSGLFDITSGILRKAWTFDGSDRVPDTAQVSALLPSVGWDKVMWGDGVLTLRHGLEIDLGGLGKEYAVDRALGLIMQASDVPVMVNFGGDLRVSGLRANGSRWRVLIEALEDDGGGAWLEVASGAITTSGDARRYVERDGRRYSHILDPRTGMSITQAPRAVTVAAGTCIEAGVLSTLAMLHGKNAEKFLKTEGVTAWVAR